VDNTTQAVRKMYEQFPYPAGRPVNRAGSDVELVLSYIERKRDVRGKYHVLDAGCGRGLGIIGAATLQPDVHFHGIDLNRVAMEEAQDSAKERGLANVTFQECDLMTLEGLEVPEGGFDVIHSSGVLHHLTDPKQGFERLRDVLAPHGVIVLMVYALHGRQPLLNVASAIDLVFGEETPLSLRLPAARTAAALAQNETLLGTSFENTFEVNDVEFVDRLLNVNETSYDIPMMWDLLEATGLRFIRWIEPGDWSLDRLLPEGELRQRMASLPIEDQFHFVELIFQRPGFEMIIAKSDSEPSVIPEPENLENCHFRLNPELIIGTEIRHTPAGVRTERLTFKLRIGDAVPVPKGVFAAIIMYLKDKLGVLKGKELLRHLEKSGVGDVDSRAVILELLRLEIIFKTR
jgi:SAM-dependent methyltransferase